MLKPQINVTRKTQELLQKYALRKTSCRTQVLALLLKNKSALAHSDLEKQLGDKFDRVTLYRTLHSFKEKGLVHSIHDVSGAVKYALSQQAYDEHQPHDNHMHFSCTACGQTFCLNEVHVPTLPLPDGYQANSLHFSAQGICNTCGSI
jgi:Fur family ferric uptake transcriptional regulator